MMISALRPLVFSPKQYINSLIFKLWLKDARFKLERIGAYLSRDTEILDIGVGSGSVSLLLEQKGYKVTPLDVRDKTLTERVKPVIYDGSVIPYSDKSFDTALLLTVLHHTKDPEAVLREALRVASNILIIEDTYNNKLQQYLTYIFDSIFNLEFIGHPHSNMTDPEWRELLKKLGLKLKDSSSDRFLFFFEQTVYYLERD